VESEEMECGRKESRQVILCDPAVAREEAAVSVNITQGRKSELHEFREKN
jgi:hypothetical protein